MPINLDEDNILGDLIQELDNSPRPVMSNITKQISRKVNEKLQNENQTK